MLATSDRCASATKLWPSIYAGLPEGICACVCGKGAYFVGGGGCTSYLLFDVFFIFIIIILQGRESI